MIVHPAKLILGLVLIALSLCLQHAEGKFGDLSHQQPRMPAGGLIGEASSVNTRQIVIGSSGSTSEAKFEPQIASETHRYVSNFRSMKSVLCLRF